MSNTAVIDKINSLNKASGYSNNRMAYELSKILKERSIQKTTSQQETSARKEFSQVFSSKSNPQKDREELANKFRDRFLKQMGVENPSKANSVKEINNQSTVVEQDKDKKKLELTVERKNDKSVALEAIKKGKGEFEITNTSVAKDELKQIQNSIEAQPQKSNQVIRTKNKNSGLEM